MNRANFDEKLKQARKFLYGGKSLRALTSFEKLVRQYPCDGKTWFDYGFAALKTGRTDLAERAWTNTRNPASDARERGRCSPRIFVIEKAALRRLHGIDTLTAI